MLQVLVDTPEVDVGGTIVDDVEIGLSKELLVVEEGLIHLVILGMGKEADVGGMVVFVVAVGEDRVGHFNFPDMFVLLVTLLHFIAHLFTIALFIFCLSAIVA